MPDRSIQIEVLKQRFPRIERWIVILENGRPLKRLMDKARVDEKDILTAARESHGLERLEEIKFAVLERSGGISIIPKKRAD
jgi:uncharacterized membrane protein YcaP (DUF421 family)